MMKRNQFILIFTLMTQVRLTQKNKLFKNMTWPADQAWSNWCAALQVAMVSDLRKSERNQLQQLLQQEDLSAQLLSMAATMPYITIFDGTYPKRLKEIWNPPLVLFYQGDLTYLQKPCLTVVGARQNGAYGQAILQQWLPQLVAQGVVIVSGLARGVDALAHEITLAAGGSTVAVIGTGLMRTYPASHRALQSAISQQGLILSEYLPDVGPQKQYFPERNRILAGLSYNTLVVEARRQSGSLITAALAVQNNRSVLAVPGAVTYDRAQGCNELIQQGAEPVLNAQDVMQALKAHYWWF